MIKAIHENDAKIFEDKVNKLVEGGYRITSSCCTPVSKVGGTMSDCGSWVAILSKKQLNKTVSSNPLTLDGISKREDYTMVKTKIKETTEKYDRDGKLIEKIVREEITEDNTDYTTDRISSTQDYCSSPNISPTYISTYPPSKAVSLSGIVTSGTPITTCKGLIK